MAIAEGKVRKYVTFDPEDFKYLKTRAAEIDASGNVTASTVIKMLIDNDRKIRETFGEPGRKKKK